MVIQSENPYEKIVGEGWADLAPGVRRAFTPPLRAKGLLRISRAHAGVAGLMARMIMLPPEGEAITSLLEVTAEQDQVQWVRNFSTMRAVSLQTFRDGAYVEEAGPFRMAFRTECRGCDLAHIQCGTTAFGIPVPAFLGPTISAIIGEGPDDKSWKVRVDIGHCWFGRFSSYEGVMSEE